jgi:hypothetical protein
VSYVEYALNPVHQKPLLEGAAVRCLASAIQALGSVIVGQPQQARLHRHTEQSGWVLRARSMHLARSYTLGWWSPPPAVSAELYYPAPASTVRVVAAVLNVVGGKVGTGPVSVYVARSDCAIGALAITQAVTARRRQSRRAQSCLLPRRQFVTAGMLRRRW